MAAKNNNQRDDLFPVAAASTGTGVSSFATNKPAALELRELGEAVARRTRSLIGRTTEFFC